MGEAPGNPEEVLDAVFDFAENLIAQQRAFAKQMLRAASRASTPSPTSPANSSGHPDSDDDLVRARGDDQPDNGVQHFPDVGIGPVTETDPRVWVLAPSGSPGNRQPCHGRPTSRACGPWRT